MKNHPFTLTTFLFSTLFLGGAGITSAAEDAPVVLAQKGHVTPAGIVSTTTSTQVIDGADLMLNAGGHDIPGTMSRTNKESETSETLSPDKIRKVTVVNETKGAVTINGQDTDTPDKPNALLNVPYVLELKGDKWVASLEGGAAPTAEQKKALEAKEKSKNTDSDFQMYGDTPRKVGDEWKVDPAKVGFSTAENLTGDYKIKLVELKEVQGVKCAVLKATYDFKGDIPAESGSPAMKLGLKGEAIATRSLADMEDIDVQIDATMTMDGSPAEGVTMHVKGPFKGGHTVEFKKP